jgi:hypothetical protein
MPVRERIASQGAARGRRIVDDLIREIEAARLARGLSRAALGREIGISGVHVGRLLGPDAERLTIVRTAQLLAACGLELSARAYPGGAPLRDAGHVALLGRLKARLHPSCRWRTEVPVTSSATAGLADRRAWDVVIDRRGWTAAVEAETRISDGQALQRRLALKQRDGDVDLVILLVSDTRHNRSALKLDADLGGAFPCTTRRALEALGHGARPDGNALIVL